MTSILPGWVLLAVGCIGDSPPPPIEDWQGDVRLHVLVPTMQVGEEEPVGVLQPIDEAELRGTLDIPTFVHQGTPDDLERSIDGCGVEEETPDIQLPEGVGGPFSDVLLLGDCGDTLGDTLRSFDVAPLFATRFTELIDLRSPDMTRGLGDLRGLLQGLGSDPIRAADCYDDILDDLCPGCEIVETTQGFTGPYGEPLRDGDARACDGRIGRTGGFGAYDLVEAGGSAVIGNLFYRAVDHEVGTGLTPLPPTLSQPNADNWRWEPSAQWPESFLLRPRIDGYVTPLAGDPPDGSAPVGWQAARHDTFSAPPEWPIEADRIYVMEKRDEPVIAIVVDLDLDADPVAIVDMRWFARVGETERGLLPAE
ncbi:MAG: hypothetical protein AAF211_30470, partial [Myxococcota bacterium]